MDSYDLVHCVMSNKIGAHDFTKQAIELESKSHYQEAVELYEKVRTVRYSIAGV